VIFLRLIIPQQVLSEALQYTVSTKTDSIIPHLSGIKLHLDSQRLTMTSCSTGCILQYEIPLGCGEISGQDGEDIVVPSRYFAELVRRLPPGPVELEVSPNRCIHVKSDNSYFSLQGTDSKEFPKIAEISHDQKIIVDNRHLRALIRRVSFAASTSESRPVLTGMSLHYAGKQVRMAATDGIRLSLHTMDVRETAPGSEIEAIIPAKHLNDFAKTLKDEHGETEIAFGENVVTFRSGPVLMQSSLIAGTYPSLDNIAPNKVTAEWTVQSASLLRAVERACLLAGESRVVTMRSNLDGVVEIASTMEEIGEVREEIVLDGWRGEPMTASFNGQYMRELLHAVDSEAVQFQFSGKWSPIIVQPVGQTASFYLLSPVRTRQYS
jgi:DNA polymerase-3 subunit beta